MPGNHLGAMLLASRIAHGWSLRDAAKATGVPNAHISQIETGSIRQPSQETLVKLAAGFSLPLEDLLAAAGYANAGRSAAEAGFLAASVAVWREIDRLDAGPEGYHPTRMSVDLRKHERAAWERYRDLLDGKGDSEEGHGQKVEGGKG